MRTNSTNRQKLISAVTRLDDTGFSYSVATFGCFLLFAAFFGGFFLELDLEGGAFRLVSVTIFSA